MAGSGRHPGPSAEMSGVSCAVYRSCNGFKRFRRYSYISPHHSLAISVASIVYFAKTSGYNAKFSRLHLRHAITLLSSTLQLLIVRQLRNGWKRLGALVFSHEP